MKKTIIINNEPFDYEAVDLKVEEGKKITFEQAKGILFFAKKILDEESIEFCLIYGTLLGAIREHSFISHDYDVDIYVEDERALLNAIPKFQEKGFKLCRVTPHRLYSFMVDDVYIDIYIFAKAPFPFNLWCYWLAGDIMPKRLFRGKEVVEFLGDKFKVPQNPENVIAFLYGKTWRTPIKGKRGRGNIYPVHYYKLWKKKLKKFFSKKK